MDTVTNDSSWLGSIFLIAFGFIIAISGARSKWQYVSRVDDTQVQNAQPTPNKPEVMVRVRRLAIIYAVCIFCMAFTLAAFVISRLTIFSVAALVFAVTTAVADFLIHLDMSKK
jgi:hypothetical protein